MNGIPEDRCITETQLKKDIKNLPANFNPGKSEILSLIAKKHRFFYIPSDFCIKRFTSKGRAVRKNQNTSAFVQKNVALVDGIAELKKFNSANKKHSARRAKESNAA